MIKISPITGAFWSADSCFCTTIDCWSSDVSGLDYCRQTQIWTLFYTERICLALIPYRRGSLSLVGQPRLEHSITSILAVNVVLVHGIQQKAVHFKWPCLVNSRHFVVHLLSSEEGFHFSIPYASQASVEYLCIWLPTQVYLFSGSFRTFVQ